MYYSKFEAGPRAAPRRNNVRTLRKICRAGALSLAMVGVLLGGPACSDPGPSRSGGAARGGEAGALDAEAEAIADAAPLIIGVRTLPEGLDPLDELDPWGQRIAEDLVFEGLVRRVDSGAPWAEPELADRCDVDDLAAPRRVYCHVPTGLHFHDGSPINVDDVVYSLEYWLDPRRSWIRERHGLGRMKGVEVVDGVPGQHVGDDEGRWVRINFDGPQPLALEHLAAIKIVPKAQHRGRTAAFRQAPVGSGPMRVASMSGDRLVLERVPGWSRGERAGAAAERIVLREIADAAQALTLLRRGEIHVLPRLAPQHVPVELGKPGMAARFRGFVRSPPIYDLLLYNLESGLSSNDTLREGLPAAVPRSTIERVVYKAPSLPIESPVDLSEPEEIDLGALVDVAADEPASGGLVAFRDPQRDVVGSERAARIFDQLGWKLERGIRQKPAGHLRIVLMWDGEPGQGSLVAQELRTAWHDLGVQVPFATASWAYLMTLIRKGAFDVALVRLSTRSDADLYPWFHSRGELNFAGVSDRDLDEALNAFRSADSPDARHAAQLAVSDRLAVLRVATVLRAPAPVMLVSRRVQGLAFEDDLPRLDRLSLAPPGDDPWES